MVKAGFAGRPPLTLVLVHTSPAEPTRHIPKAKRFPSLVFSRLLPDTVGV